jgi:hypothetical protein
VSSPLDPYGWAEPRLMTAYDMLDELYQQWRDPEGGRDELSDMLKSARDLCEDADVMIEDRSKGGFV